MKTLDVCQMENVNGGAEIDWGSTACTVAVSALYTAAVPAAATPVVGWIAFGLGTLVGIVACYDW